MSYTYLQDQGEESSAECFADIARSAPSRSIPTAGKSYSNDNGMESFLGSPCGTMCEPSMARNGKEKPTWSLVDSHALTSRQPEKGQGSKAKKADSGVRWHASSAKWDRDTSSWKTHPCLFNEVLPWSSVILPRWGMLRDGELLERMPPDTLTEGKGSGSSLPTPSGVNGGNNHTMGRVDEWGGSSNPLRGTVIGSMCSPEFEELVMGWPVTWTELTPLETDRFRAWCDSLGISYDNKVITKPREI